ncbi:hypothetical protein [Streptomyces thermolilacinus]|uniref:hypothetical protein n=1 Tax=Streptomyces thermolilacinus TaxID=285540 RepID=UPI0033F28C88
MGLRKKTAEKLDAAAGALHEAGRKAAGEKGGRVGDAIANATLAPLRGLCDTPCTCRKCRTR